MCYRDFIIQSVYIMSHWSFRINFWLILNGIFITIDMNLIELPVDLAHASHNKFQFCGCFIILCVEMSLDMIISIPRRCLNTLLLMLLFFRLVCHFCFGITGELKLSKLFGLNEQEKFEAWNVCVHWISSIVMSCTRQHTHSVIN